MSKRFICLICTLIILVSVSNSQTILERGLYPKGVHHLTENIIVNTNSTILTGLIFRDSLPILKPSNVSQITDNNYGTPHNQGIKWFQTQFLANNPGNYFSPKPTLGEYVYPIGTIPSGAGNNNYYMVAWVYADANGHLTNIEFIKSAKILIEISIDNE